MATKLKKSYRFALRSSLIISLLVTAILVTIQFFSESFDWVLLAIAGPAVFLVAVVTIQSRVERFIYRRVKKLYDEVSLLESENLPRTKKLR